MAALVNPNGYKNVYNLKLRDSNYYMRIFEVKFDLHANNAYTAYMKSIQYTIRGIPTRINSRIRSKASKEGKSLNSVIIEVLSRGLGLTDEMPKYNDLDDIIGTWVEDPEFDAAVKEMDQVDQDLWR